ncbi:hypothetical protein LB504_009512 [Fusarium proliferatum]|nr:hypothetical protein LB504_009512 [Fusarium proliferatum]
MNSSRFQLFQSDIAISRILTLIRPKSWGSPDCCSVLFSTWETLGRKRSTSECPVPSRLRLA